jgi:hypothetical protein
MRDGAEQLASLNVNVLAVPHSRVLVGTSIDDRLFTLLEHETHHPANIAAGGDPAAGLFNLTRARLIVYLFLSSQGYERLRTVTVARGDAATRFSETDDSTREMRDALRGRLQDDVRGPLPPDLATRATEFLTSRVPGIGMRVGMSPGLFRACQGLLASLEQTIVEVASERPNWSRYGEQEANERLVRAELSEEEELERVAEFKEAVDQRIRGQRHQVRTDYDLGAREGMAIGDYPERADTAGDLEMYSDNVYVALDSGSVLMGPLRRA